MADIIENIKTVREGVYGIDVREAIADSIEQMNDISIETVEIVGDFGKRVGKAEADIAVAIGNANTATAAANTATGKANTATGAANAAASSASSAASTANTAKDAANAAALSASTEAEKATAATTAANNAATNANFATEAAITVVAAADAAITRANTATTSANNAAGKANTAAAAANDIVDEIEALLEEGDVARNEYGLFTADAATATGGYWYKIFTCKSSRLATANINMSLKVLGLFPGGGRGMLGGILNIGLRFNASGIATSSDSDFQWESCTTDISGMLGNFALNIIPESDGANIELYIYNDKRYGGYIVSVISKSARETDDLLTFAGVVDWRGTLGLTSLPTNGAIMYSKLGYYLAQTPSTKNWPPLISEAGGIYSLSGKVTKIGEMVTWNFSIDFRSEIEGLGGSGLLSIQNLPYRASMGATGICELSIRGESQVSGWLRTSDTGGGLEVFQGADRAWVRPNTRYIFQGSITYYTDE
jgi:Membrane protein involved in colicin uptake